MKSADRELELIKYFKRYNFVTFEGVDNCMVINILNHEIKLNFWFEVDHDDYNWIELYFKKTYSSDHVLYDFTFQYDYTYALEIRVDKLKNMIDHLIEYLIERYSIEDLKNSDMYKCLEMNKEEFNEFIISKKGIKKFDL